MSIMQVLLSREGLSPDGSVEVSEDTLAAIESSDVEADVVETDIEAVAVANEEATEVEQGVEEVAEAVTAMEAIMERIVAATADGSKLTPRESASSVTKLTLFTVLLVSERSRSWPPNPSMLVTTLPWLWKVWLISLPSC